MSFQVALVTGAGRGIGRACALALAGEGLAVALTARSADQLAAVASEAREAGAPAALAHPADLGVLDDLDGLIAALQERFGRLDLLVQNAGLFEAAPLAETSDEDWDRLITVNLTAPFRLLRRCLPLLRASSRAHVVHILSAVVSDVFPGCAAYTASKRGLQGLSAVAREELREAGIGVTDILPGAVDTAAWDGVPGDVDRSRMLRAEDVARGVVHAWGDGERAWTEEITLKPRAGNL